MEVVLNLVWLAIAVTALARLGAWARAEPDGRRIAIATLSTLCILAVLFPIISMTDDLQSDIVAAEEQAALRRTASMLLQVVLVFFAPAPVSASSHLTRAFLSEIAGENVTVPSFREARSLTRRGPPSIG
ncbi:MAG TPA: hypothetical protein VF381_03070 [Thermoanaerobaculia bacterium]